MRSRTPALGITRNINPHAGGISQSTIVIQSLTTCASLFTGDVVQTLGKPFLVELQEVTVLVIPLNLGILDYHSSVCCLSDDLLVHVDELERLHFVVGRTVGLQLDWKLVVCYQGRWKEPQILVS